MLETLLTLHSILRLAVMAFLFAVIIKSFVGWIGKKPFTKTDDRISLFLLIFTHTQFLLGVLLYFVSPRVQFNNATMKDPSLRYWTVEHIFMMLIAITLITIARITSKRMAADGAKLKRLFYFNTFALLIVIVAIEMSHRGLFAISSHP